MIETSVEETRTERLIRAFMAGVEAELMEIRGYGLTASEREDYEAEAIAIYGEPGVPAPSVAVGTAA